MAWWSNPSYVHLLNRYFLLCLCLFYLIFLVSIILFFYRSFFLHSLRHSPFPHRFSFFLVFISLYLASSLCHSRMLLFLSFLFFYQSVAMLMSPSDLRWHCYSFTHYILLFYFTLFLVSLISNELFYCLSFLIPLWRSLPLYLSHVLSLSLYLMLSLPTPRSLSLLLSVSLSLLFLFQYGWDTKPEDDHSAKLLRSTVIGLLDNFCSSDEGVLAEAKRRFNGHFDDPSLLPSDYKVCDYILCETFL